MIRRNNSPSSFVSPAADPAEEKRRRKDYAIYPMIHHGEIAFVGGPTYVGKTILMLTMLDNWRAGKPVFGEFVSYPTDFVYVACSDSAGYIQRAAARIGIDKDDLPLIPANMGKTPTFQELVTRAVKLRPNVKTLFVDGIHRLAPGGRTNDYGEVVKVMDAIRTILQENKLTMIASGRSSKPKDNYSVRTVDRFLGSTAWTEGVPTFIGIEQANPSDATDAKRIITVNGEFPTVREIRELTKDGRLVPVQEIADEERTAEAAASLEELLASHPAGTQISYADILEMGVMLGISERTCARYVIGFCERARLLRVGHGRYQIPMEQ